MTQEPTEDETIVATRALIRETAEFIARGQDTMRRGDYGNQDK